MPRLPHGEMITTAQVQEASAELNARSAGARLAFLAQPADLERFDFLFPALQADPDSLLPEDPSTAANLSALGRTMKDPGPGADPGDSEIPAAYTYFGQFVDHDITLDVLSGSLQELLDPGLTPMTVPEILSKLHNMRTATLDLDNLYSLPAPRDPANANKMVVGPVAPTNSTDPPLLRPPGKTDDNDVPREPPNPDDHSHDRAALIGDPRNDENTIIAQMQVAFLKAHNALVDQGHSFEEARRILRQHYQHLVVHDYLMRIADPAVVNDILQNGPKIFDPPANNFFMPLEFSVAAFRFGHTMVRDAYDFNVNFNLRAIPASLDLLFTFSALSGEMFDFDTLPENWIIQWENLVDIGQPFNRARRLDTKLVEPLFELRDAEGDIEPDDGARLAVRNLRRGYLLRMPTGQAAAAALGIPALTPDELRAAAASPEQVQALEAGGFLDRTPLWYYVLAEAEAAGGQHLGPVGSTLVADVLIGVARRSADSIFNLSSWRPTLPSSEPGRFELRDLLAFAGVLPELQTSPQPRSLIHVVQPGDTLFGIAESELGDGNRWPQIWALNRDKVIDPDLIFPGQELTLPDPASTDPVPQVHRVVPGDTLSAIARDKLGDANRFPEIFALNRNILNDPNLIFPGQVLLLPAA